MPWTSAPDVETWNNVWTGISRLRKRAVETIREIDFPVVFDRSSRAVWRCCDISQLSMGISFSAVMVLGERLLNVDGFAVRDTGLHQGADKYLRHVLRHKCISPRKDIPPRTQR